MAAGEEKHPEASTKPRTKAESILSGHSHRTGTLIVLSTMITFPVQKLRDSLHPPRGDLAFSCHWTCPKGMGPPLELSPKDLTVTHPSWQMRRISAVNLQTFQKVSLQPPLPRQMWQINAAAVGTGRGKKPPPLPCSSCPEAVCVPAAWHLLAAWNLRECKTIREACGHSKCTYAHLRMCAHIHTLRCVSIHIAGTP